jgi:hypothetical protein
MSRAEITRIRAQRAGHREPPIVVGPAKRVKPRLRLAMSMVRQHEQGLIEKRFLSLALADPALIRALARVSRIPIEADDNRPVQH